MKPNQIAKLGVVVLVIAAVAVVLRLKQEDLQSSIDGPSTSISAVAAAGESRTPPPAPPSDANDDAFQGPARQPLPRLLDLGADKCIPCKKMAPILAALEEEYASQFDVEFIDVWKNREAAGPYGIKLIPTQIFFDAESRELFRHEGFFSREDILTAWSDLGYVFEAATKEEPG